MLVDEQELIKRVIVNDDQLAFKELVKYHQSALRLFLRRILKKEELADEVAQEAFWIAYRKLDQLQKGNLRSWLFTIAYRLALKELKIQNRVPMWEQENQVEWGQRAGSDLQCDLSRALSQLPAEDRQLLLAWAKQGLSHQELATSYGMPLGSVKSIIMRARYKLKRKLADWRLGG